MTKKAKSTKARPVLKPAAKATNDRAPATKEATARAAKAGIGGAYRGGVESISADGAVRGVGDRSK